MFGSIADDFDRRHATGLAVAVMIADAAAVLGGVAWLMGELLVRLAWILLNLLLSWLFQPAFATAVLPPPPITVALTQRVASISAAPEAVDVEVIGDWEWDPTPDPVLTEADLPREPGDLDELLLADTLAFATLDELDRPQEAQLMGMIALLGSSGDGELSSIFGTLEGDSIADVFGEAELGGSGIGGLIGSGGAEFGVGGLGVRGVGGGGTAEGLGGLGLGAIGTIGEEDAGRGRGGLGTRGRGRAREVELVAVDGVEGGVLIGALSSAEGGSEGGVLGGVEGGVVGGLDVGVVGGVEGGVVGEVIGGAPGGVVGSSAAARPKLRRAATPSLDDAARAWLDANGSSTCTVTVRVTEDGSPARATVGGCPSALRAAAERVGLDSTFEGTGVAGTVTMRVVFEP